MAYCSETDVRNSDRKLESTTDVTQTVILERIAKAEDIVKVALSSIISENDLDDIGSTSKVVNLLTTYKSVELVLVTYYGVSRKVDELTDVQYFQKQYKDLLTEVLNGTVKLIAGVTDRTPKDYPALSSGKNKKFYPRKGIAGVSPDGDNTGTDYVDDTIQS